MKLSGWNLLLQYFEILLNRHSPWGLTKAFLKAWRRHLEDLLTLPAEGRISPGNCFPSSSFKIQLKCHFCQSFPISVVNYFSLCFPAEQSTCLLTRLFGRVHIYLLICLSQDLQLPEGKRYCISSVFRYIFFPPHFYISEISFWWRVIV